MKFFYKIFLSMLLVLTVSLATIEYLTVSYSLEHALQQGRKYRTLPTSDGQIFDPDSATWHYGRLHNVNMENIAKSAETPLGAQSGLFLPVKNSQSGER